jgi:hypothetical protein
MPGSVSRDDSACESAKEHAGEYDCYRLHARSDGRGSLDGLEEDGDVVEDRVVGGTACERRRRGQLVLEKVSADPFVENPD